MRALIAVLLQLLAPARTTNRISSIATVAAFALGAVLACAPLLAIVSPAVLLCLAAGLAGLAILSSSARPTWTRFFATAVLVVMHLGWIYIVASLGTLLAWTTPPLVRWLVALLAVAAVGGAFAPRARFRVPAALPLGIWITACVIGWSREDGVIRCDDYTAVRTSMATVLVPTTDELDNCSPGESLRIGHYPRRLWEAPEGRRLVMTTQHGINRFAPPGRVVPDRFPGTVCDVPIDGTPSCFGGGKAHAIVDAPERESLFVVGWGNRFPDGRRGVFYALSRTTPLRLLLEVHLVENVVGLFFDPITDTVGLLSDEGEVMRPVRVSDGVILDPVPAPVMPDETRVNESTGEGVFCFAAGPLRRLDGEAFLSTAFQVHPFSLRALGGARQNPSAWLSMVWGCDWDAATRRVYVANASLGFLAILDYDSGKILSRIPVGFGFRYVTLDRERRLVHLANFLRGDIVSLDLDTGAEVARWFAGRFVRQVILARDRQALLVTSNIGVVRIPLEELARTRNPQTGSGPSR